MVTLLWSVIRSSKVAFGGITVADRPNFPFCSIALALICALHSPCVAQSSAEHCAALGQRYVDALEEAQKNDSLDDIEFLGNDKKRASEDLEEYWAKPWQGVIATGRRYLGNCPNGTIRATAVLEDIAHGLIHQGQQKDAIPILNKCITIDHDDSGCWLELGRAETGLCQFDDAREAFQRVVALGGSTTLDALLVEKAKLILGELEIPRIVELLRARWICPPQSAVQPVPAVGPNAKRYGTGFFVTKKGQILTNDHVVEGCGRLATSDGKALTVIDRNAKVDLALLKADATPDAVATFRSGQPPKPGDEVVAFGFPLPDILASEGNVSTGVLSATAGLQNDVRFVQISAPVQPGNSGGPLLDASGLVIGVVVAKLDALRMARLTGDVPQNVNFAVHWCDSASIP